MLEERGH